MMAVGTQAETWMFFGDGVWAKQLNRSNEYTDQFGHRVMKFRFEVPRGTIRYLGIDIDKVGVDKFGNKGGEYLERKYPSPYVEEGMTTYSSGNRVNLTVIRCDLNGGETRLTRLHEGKLQLIRDLQDEIERKNVHLIRLKEENEILRAGELKAYLKEYADVEKILKQSKSDDEEVEDFDQR